MKRRERFMAATGWNVDPRVVRSGQCFPRHVHTSGLHGRKEPCSTSRNGQERLHHHDAVFPTGSPLQLAYESTNYGAGR